MTQDQINEVAPKAEEKELPLDMEAKAKKEGALYLKPKRKLKPISKLKPELKKMRDHDWEYVKGVYQNESLSGIGSNEPKEFWFLKWPGDEDCLWEVPVNIPVYLPRMVARHLAGEKQSTGMEAMKYHTFDYKENPELKAIKNEVTESFIPVATHYIGKFTAVGAFS